MAGIAAWKREKGKLDIVFANAGITPRTPLGTITEEDYNSIFNANVKGLLFTCRRRFHSCQTVPRLS
jgi:NAD(P)-dependent dehydrogenase (short-subunit alcohol dehydrogenase family)